MLLIDDNTPSLITVAAAGKPNLPDVPQDEFAQKLLTTDSITQTISDSLKNMNLTDLKDVVTGQNTILYVVVRSLGRVRPLCDPIDCSTSGFPVLHISWNLLKLMSIESVMFTVP